MAETPSRFAWVGLSRGPLSPTEARAIEVLLLDELDGYDSFRLVDAGGHALDDRLLASGAALVARLLDEGIDLFLRFEHKPALKKFDLAIGIFENDLVSLHDHSLLHDTMLAKAEAQFQDGSMGAAEVTLRELASLMPKKRPKAKTHAKKLVRMWHEAQAKLGPVGSINISCEDPTCTIQLDGKILEQKSPFVLTKVRAGKHYIVARWPFARIAEPIRVAPGRESKVTIRRAGPSEEARMAVLDAIDQRAGAEEASGHATRVASLARAEGVLEGALRKDAEGNTWLLLAKHDEVGSVESVAGLELPQGEEVTGMVRRMGAALFMDKRMGELEIQESGTVIVREGLKDLLFGGGRADAAEDADQQQKFLTEPDKPKTEPEDPIYEKWWFWTAMGVVVVGAGAVTIGVMAGRDPTTTTFEVNLP